MPSLPAARISHFTARRLRIKVPEKRRNTDFFDTVAERLATWDSVERVETNPLTASVLIHFSDPERLFLEAAAKNDLFDIDFDAAFGDSSDARRHRSGRAIIRDGRSCAAPLDREPDRHARRAVRPAACRRRIPAIATQARCSRPDTPVVRGGSDRAVERSRTRPGNRSFVWTGPRPGRVNRFEPTCRPADPYGGPRPCPLQCTRPQTQ